MKTETNISLKNYNTFHIDVKASKLITINSKEELISLLPANESFFILSGGSNMLLTKNIKQTILHINSKGKEMVKETKKHVFIKVQAGENWHNFVLWCVNNNYGGIENLALIPGKVGTSPIQNIGAYGVEVKDVISKVNVVKIKSGKEKTFKNKACKFGYRESIFKGEKKGKYIITEVIFKLTKENHNLKFEYGAIKEELASQTPTISSIAKAVINIRSEKLPNPNEIGNSGSFFKNPIVSKNIFKNIQTKHPKMPFYTVENGIKIPAGWLIEQSGFKGKRFGDAGVHVNQALVLVNYNNATGKEILNLANKIKETVKKEFYIELNFEVNII